MAGVVACVLLALAGAAPVWASVSATVALAPVGAGSYLLALTNTGSETITGFAVIGAGQDPTDITPSPACARGVLSGAILCHVTVAPGASTQICYSGSPAGAVEVGEYQVDIPALSPAVASCPQPGFTVGSGSAPGTSTPGSSTTPGSSSTHGTTSKGAHAWTDTRCKSAYKAWTKKQRRANTTWTRKHRHANGALTRKHRRAMRRQRKAEASKLHKRHGCPLSILK